MHYYLTSDDAAIANQIRAILLQLHQECPASHLLRLDIAVSVLVAAASSVPKDAKAKTDELDNVVLVVLSPDPERALAIVREVRRRTMNRILVVGPTTDTKLVLRALREGAMEYLDQGELLTELSGALKRLDASGTSGRIIGILAPGGGSGSSTLSVNVATTLTQKFQSCALIDLKLEAGDLAPLLDLKPNHTISDLCQNIDRLDFSLLQGCLATSKNGVQLLAAPARIADIASVTPEAVGLILSLIARHFPFVVMDLDHSFRPEQRRALLQADLIVLVLRLDFISLHNARITLDFFQEIGISRDKVRFVANRVGEPNQLSEAQAESSLGMKFFQLIPEEPKTVNRANNNGIPVVEQSPATKVSRSMVELALNLAKPVKSSE